MILKDEKRWLKNISMTTLQKILIHKHCNRCGSVLNEIGRLSYKSKTGIVVVSKCECGIWIDEENGEMKEVYQRDLYNN